MPSLDEHRDGGLTRTLLSRIRSVATRRWVLMEVCGGPPHTIVTRGVRALVTPVVEMLHGPGCPLCVTPVAYLDKARRLAAIPNVIVAIFGDALGGAGHECEAHTFRDDGNPVHVVHSPLDALELAIKHPDQEVVFFGVGFETTAPANAMAVWRARQLDVRNFSLLVFHVTVPPAMRTVLEAPGNRVEAFLAAGHACSVMGWMEYEPIAARYRVPIVVTGVEAVDVLEGIYMAVRQLEEGRYEVENQYARSGRREGLLPARDLVAKVFQVVDRQWRGIGLIPGSGLALRAEYADYDAELRFGLAELPATDVAARATGGSHAPADQ